MATTLEATLHQEGDYLDYTPVAAGTAGEVRQMADGRAGVPSNDLVAARLGALRVSGVFRLQKTTGIVLLPGGDAFWDHSANKVHFKRVNDRDFFIGTVTADAASADTICYVNLNVESSYQVELGETPWTKTDTLGLGTLAKIGGRGIVGEFDNTSEAALSSLLSEDSFVIGSNPIAEFRMNVRDNGASALDINVGFANAGHATDADSITESCFIHIDGNSLNILAESDDGTTEVVATDTTLDYVVGTPVEIWMDMRTPGDVQIYVDGVLVLPSTTFDLSAATGPLKLLYHMEKTAGTSTGKVELDFFRARTAED